MKHNSIAMDSPIEFIDITSINPLLDECVIKVLYVDDKKPNRNKTLITKEFAQRLAGTLPGSPIVGHYNEANQDFEEHNELFEIKNGQIYMTENTRPYGFVPTDAKVWFQKFLDDGVNEREYLCTTGYLWTGQYPEAKRVIDEGNNQSMRLKEDSVSGAWAKNINSSEKFFIINEAIIQNLCILGEEVEPCFEGSQITSYSFNPQLTQSFYSMMEDIQNMIKGGPTPMFVNYAVEIGSTLWSVIYEYLYKTFPDTWFSLQGIYEEGEQKFAVLQCPETGKLFRLNFTYDESNGFVPAEELLEVAISFDPVYSLEDIQAYEASFKAQKAAEEEAAKKAAEETPVADYAETCPKCGKPVNECICEEEEGGKELKEGEKTYSASEFDALNEKFNALTTNYEALVAEKATLEAQVESLTKANEALAGDVQTLKEFKLAVEKAEKQAMIDKFTMLSESDKIDVIQNIDKYSLDEIESKLCVICVRNKVRFDDENNEDGNESHINTYSLQDTQTTNIAPDWIKSVKIVADELKI